MYTATILKTKSQKLIYGANKPGPLLCKTPACTVKPYGKLC